MKFNNQQFIQEFKTLIEKEKESNKIIKGKINDINQNTLHISAKHNSNLTKNMSVEVNRVKAEVMDVKNKNIKLNVQNNSVFSLNQIVSIQNIQKDIIIHKLQEIMDMITNNKLSPENMETLNILFANETPTFNEKSIIVKNLNKNQNRAVEKSLVANKFYLIQGPPGTGKTHTITEIIKRLYENNKKILITTHTHIALDNILERLTSFDENKILRIGDTNKVSNNVTRYTMENQIKQHEMYNEIIIKENQISNLSKNIGRKYDDICYDDKHDNFISRIFRTLFQSDNYEENSNNSGTYQYDIDNNDSINELKLEIDNITKNIQRDILDNIKIFASTVLSSSSFLLKDIDFDYVIMDEASQVPVYLSLIPLLKTDKFILIGDNKQLQPIQNDNSSYTLNKSIFNLLIDKYPENYTFLNIQYRMNEQISNIASKLYYNNMLLTGDAVKKQRIKLKFDKYFLLDDEPITILDTSNVSFKEEVISGGCCNKYESDLILNIVNALKNNDIPLNEIGIITPYKKQKFLIKKLLARNNLDVECDTIYRFQGREKDVIIVSFCKSSNKSLTKFQENFLSDKNQLNVSITRSRKKLILIGNFDMIKSSKNIKNLINEVSLENILFLEDIL